MGHYGPVLYHRQLCPRCARVRRTLRTIGLEVELRSVLLSRRHRRELLELVGAVEVPCLIVAGTVVREVEEIEKFLRLRYGERG